MTTITTARPSGEAAPANRIVKLVNWVVGSFECIPSALVQLFARLAIAPVFWLSGQTKVDGWTVKETTFDLFRYEYDVPVLPPELAAYMATFMEHALPILLVVGLATRFTTLGLLGMTLVIQLRHSRGGPSGPRQVQRSGYYRRQRAARQRALGAPGDALVQHRHAVQSGL